MSVLRRILGVIALGQVPVDGFFVLADTFVTRTPFGLWTHFRGGAYHYKFEAQRSALAWRRRAAEGAA